MMHYDALLRSKFNIINQRYWHKLLLGLTICHRNIAENLFLHRNYTTLTDARKDTRIMSSLRHILYEKVSNVEYDINI